MGEPTGEEVLREVEVLEALTRGDIEGEGGVDGVVEEGNESEVGEVAEEGRERAGDVGVGEVEGDDGEGSGVAFDAAPVVAWSGVAVVPGGEGGVWVGEGVLYALEVETLLVQREGEG